MRRSRSPPWPGFAEAFCGAPIEPLGLVVGELLHRLVGGTAAVVDRLGELVVPSAGGEVMGEVLHPDRSPSLSCSSSDSATRRRNSQATSGTQRLVEGRPGEGMGELELIGTELLEHSGTDTLLQSPEQLVFTELDDDSRSGTSISRPMIDAHCND